MYTLIVINHALDGIYGISERFLKSDHNIEAILEKKILLQGGKHSNTHSDKKIDEDNKVVS